MNLAFSAGSYHLCINAPTAMYLYEQQLRCNNCTKLLERSWRGSIGKDGCYHQVVSDSRDDCHYHMRRRRGQSYLHLYMHGYGSSRQPLRNLEVLARFKEIPPGTRGAAAVAALVETIIIWATGFLISRNRDVSTDLPLFFLGLPAVMASWVGMTSDTGSIVGTSLIARLSLLLSGLISLVAVVVYLVEVHVTGQSTQSHTAHYIALAGITNLIWLILFLCSAGNFAYILWRLVRKMYFYDRLVSRPGPVEGVSIQS